MIYEKCVSCVAAEVEDLIDLAKQFKQRTLYGIGFARRLKIAD